HSSTPECVCSSPSPRFIFSFFFLIHRLPPRFPLFPYTTLFRSLPLVPFTMHVRIVERSGRVTVFTVIASPTENKKTDVFRIVHRDRKSTRLNSSHRTISYAVFCLKKKIQHHPFVNLEHHDHHFV